MSHPFHRALTTAFASILFSAVTPHGWAGDSAQVAAQRLTAPTASSKVGAVLWTRRADRYTLQVVFPRESRELTLVDGRRPKLNAENPAAQIPGAPSPVVTLWLLGANGTVIPASIERPLGAQPGKRPVELAYSVSLAAGERVVAAALKVDEQYFIESLHDLSGK